MDEHLENTDLGELFASHGEVKNPKIKKINLDLPVTVINQLDKIADKIGVARQPLLKIWIHERIQTELHK